MALSDLLRMCKKDPYRRTLYAFNIWNSSSTYAFNTDVRIEHLAGTVIKLRTHCEDTSQARTECRSGATTLAPTSDSRPRRQARYARCVCFLSAESLLVAGILYDRTRAVWSMGTGWSFSSMDYGPKRDWRLSGGVRRHATPRQSAEIRRHHSHHKLDPT